MEKTKSRPRCPAGESEEAQPWARETGTASVTEKQTRRQTDAAAEKQTEGDEPEEKEIEEDRTQTSTAENSETRE